MYADFELFEFLPIIKSVYNSNSVAIPILVPVPSYVNSPFQIPTPLSEISPSLNPFVTPSLISSSITSPQVFSPSSLSCNSTGLGGSTFNCSNGVIIISEIPSGSILFIFSERKNSILYFILLFYYIILLF